MMVALGTDMGLGWPDRLYRVAGHPVGWIGRAIGALDHGLNQENASAATRRAAGVVTVVVVVGGVGAFAGGVAALLPEGVGGAVIAGLLAWPLVAARSMADHVEAVAGPLEAGELEAARAQVARIVGRDVSALDEAGVARAALESLAENSSDGIVAPLFWGVLLGLPGIAAYKAVNTLDSMIGYRTPRHRDFGWAAARLDDVVNLVPARLTGLLYALVSGRLREGWNGMMTDANLHRSPNAGWPEAALAHVMSVRLSGPRAYAGRVTEEPWVNAAGRDPSAADLRAGLGLFRRMNLGLLALLGLLAVMGV